MNMWLKCSHIETLLFEINRIWNSTGIQFINKGCGVYNTPPSENQSDALAILEGSIRSLEEEDIELNIQRKEAIKTVSARLGIQHPRAINIFFVPFMGSTRQGNAMGGKTNVCVGVWTDKPSRGQALPQKTKLYEPGPFNIGSLGRTIAHEIGHCLDLNHNDSPLRTPNIMGNPDGYGFEGFQIIRARARAKEHLYNFSRY